MGSCAICGGDIPDGTTFCGIHAFDPGKSSKGFPDAVWEAPDQPTGGGGGGNVPPFEPTSDPPEDGGFGGSGGGGYGGGFGSGST